MNVANKITLGRIILIPIFMVFALVDAIPYGRIISLGIFLLASLTDMLDGKIARKYNLVTTMGKFLDPLADKLLIIAALLCFVEMGLTPAYLAMIIVARELVVTTFRIVAMGSGVIIAADIWGKIKTTVQIIAVVAVLLEDFIWHTTVWSFWLMVVATAITLFSGFHYLYKNRAVFHEQ